MRPEELYAEAVCAINNHDWPKATAFATTGLLGLAIGASKAVEALGAATEYQ